MHPKGTGSFADCWFELVGWVQRSPALAVIQAGKTVRVPVALAYRLVLGPTDATWWSVVVEKVTALGKVVTELSENQSTKTGRQQKQTRREETQHLPSDHQVAESSSLGGQKPLLLTHTRLDPFIRDENSNPVGGFYPNFPCYMVRQLSWKPRLHISCSHLSAEVETIFSHIFSAVAAVWKPQLSISAEHGSQEKLTAAVKSADVPEKNTHLCNTQELTALFNLHF